MKAYIVPGSFLGLFLFSISSLAAQPMLRLKSHTETTPAGQVLSVPAGHRILQFDAPPAPDLVQKLAARGAHVLADIPDDALLVSADQEIDLDGLGVRYATALTAEDKISPLVPRAAAANPRRMPQRSFFLVEFHADIDKNVGRAILLNLGFDLRENPDLAPHHLMIYVPDPVQAHDKLMALAARDEVAYIFPASDELARGTFVIPCTGALTANGLVAQLIPTYGDGWDGPGRNAATLNYVFGNMTTKVAAGTAQSEILRAMNEWSKVIALKWQQGSSATSTRTVNVFFASGSHGDSYPFDGPGNVLAHTFFPAPPNAESLAGDMHLDDDEAWRVGANIDIYSVALHELGHALGLGHSDNPSAVMYPYYRMASTLAADDVSAILSLYAAATASTPAPAPSPTPTPLTLAVNVPASTTTSTAISITGTVTGGSGTPAVTWLSSPGASGVATLSGANWTIPSVPLAVGSNTITITASSGGTQVSRSLTITRQNPTPPPVSDTTAPSILVSAPGSTSVLTSATSIRFQGTASDNVGVVRVTYETSAGYTGTATGTTMWYATVPLRVGLNIVSVRAYDAAGNNSWRTYLVTRR